MFAVGTRYQTTVNKTEKTLCVLYVQCSFHRVTQKVVVICRLPIHVPSIANSSRDNIISNQYVGHRDHPLHEQRYVTLEEGDLSVSRPECPTAV
jgi:nitrous oxidase accessory protein NosD